MARKERWPEMLEYQQKVQAMTDLERAQSDTHFLTDAEVKILDKALRASTTLVAKSYTDVEIEEIRAAARREGAAEMRERAAQRAENLWFDARDTEWDEGVNCAKRRVAHAIRSLPLGAE